MKYSSGLALIGAMALAGCTASPTAANKSNFAAAINRHFAKHANCASLRLPNGVNKGTADGITAFAIYYPSKKDPTIGAMNALVSASLFERTNHHVGGAFGIITADTTTRQLDYSLTAKGHAAYVEPAYDGAFGITHVPSLCTGTVHVVAIKNFTTPHPDQLVGGATATQVDYSYELVDRPEWIRTAAIQRQFGAAIGADSGKAEAVLMLKNDGWHVTQ